jgi:hypothetical protein
MQFIRSVRPGVTGCCSIKTLRGCALGKLIICQKVVDSVRKAVDIL